jgi:hypothetical protein
MLKRVVASAEANAIQCGGRTPIWFDGAQTRDGGKEAIATRRTPPTGHKTRAAAAGSLKKPKWGQSNFRHTADEKKL